MSNSDDDALALAAFVLVKKRKSRIKKRAVWCKEWLMKRKTYSHINLLSELKIYPRDWHNYLRMDEETYLNLLSFVSPLIQKQDTIMREAITPHERLTATLRFLATGRSYEDLKYSTIISPQALSYIVPETCHVIYKVLRSRYLKVSNRTILTQLFIYFLTKRHTKSKYMLCIINYYKLTLGIAKI